MSSGTADPVSLDGFDSQAMARSHPVTAANLVLVTYNQHTGTVQNAWDVLAATFGAHEAEALVRQQAVAERRFDGTDLQALFASVGHTQVYGQLP